MPVAISRNKNVINQREKREMIATNFGAIFFSFVYSSLIRLLNESTKISSMNRQTAIHKTNNNKNQHKNVKRMKKGRKKNVRKK